MSALTLKLAFDGPESAPLRTVIVFNDACEECLLDDEHDEENFECIEAPSAFGLTDVIRARIREYPRLQSVMVAMEEGSSRLNITAVLERAAEQKTRISLAVRETSELVAAAAQVSTAARLARP